MENQVKPFPREILLVFGKTGMGKSNYLKGFLQSLKRVIILDPLDEYPGMEFDDAEDMVDYLLNLGVNHDPMKPFCVKSCNVLDLEILGNIVGYGDRKDDPNAMRNVTFLIEEAQRCLPASRQDLPESIQKIIFQGRHFGRSLAIAAQRPSIVHIAARSQWNRIVTFNLTEDGDVIWLKNTTGYTMTESENDLRKLPIGDYYEITPGSFERKHAPLYVPRKTAGREDNVSNVFKLFSASNL